MNKEIEHIIYNLAASACFRLPKCSHYDLITNPINQLTRNIVLISSKVENCNAVRTVLLKITVM